MSSLHPQNRQSQSFSTTILIGLGAIATAGLVIAALFFSTDGVEGIATSGCSGCTINITGTDAGTYTLTDGDVFCIAAGGTFSGTIQRNSGNGSVIICNEGTISGASLSFNKGENYLENHGTMLGSTLSFNSNATVANFNNYQGATATFASVNFYTAQTQVQNFGTFSTGDFTISSGATFTNGASGTVTSGKVAINSNSVLENNGTWNATGNVTVNSQGELDNNASFSLTGNLVNNNDIFSTGTMDIGGNLVVNSNAQTELANANTVGGFVTLNQSLVLDGSLSVATNLTINSNGVLRVDGVVEVKGDLTMGGDIYGKSVASGQYGSIAIDGVTTIYSNGYLHDNLDFCDAGFPSSGADNFWGNADATVTYCENTGGSLPVEWLAFEAAIQEEGVELTWMTGSEVNNDFFTVERSTDAEEYEALSIVDAIGQSSEPTVYQLTDRMPPSGRLYYRIRQTDFDGNMSFSDQIEVLMEETVLRLSVYPNPVSEIATVELNLPEATSGTIALMSIAGQEMRRIETELPAGKSLQQLDVSEFPAGIYLLQLRTAGNAQWETIRLVKQ